MRRGVTVLVVVVVAAIALAAGIDALRGGSDSEPAAQTEAEPPTVSTSADVEAPPSGHRVGRGVAGPPELLRLHRRPARERLRT
jgi:hypothetical protein